MYEVALGFSVLCYLAVGVFYLRHRAFSIFHPLTFYMAFHGILFVFRPILAYLLEYKLIYLVYHFLPSDSDKLIVVLASNLGFLTFAFFSLYAGNVAMRFRQDAFNVIERTRLETVIPWVLAICVPIAGYSLISLWIAAGLGTAYDDMAVDRMTGIRINTSGNGYFVESQLMLASCGAIVGWVFRFRLLAVLPLAAFVLLRAGTGGRGPFVTALVTLALLFFYEKRQRFPGAKVIVVAALLLASFSIVGEDRGRAIRDAVGADQTREGYSRYQYKFMEGMDFGNLEYFEYIVYVVPKRSGTYDYFLENLQLFTEPIPRVLWPGKPVGAPIKRVYLFDYGSPVGMTKSLPGQGWYFMSWFGVVIWCGLWGYGLGWIYRRFVEGPQNTLQVATYMIFLPVMVVAYRDGTILTVFRQGIFFLAPIALWFLIARMRGIPAAQTMRIAAYQQWRNRKRAAEVPGAPIEPAPRGRRIAERPVRRRGVVFRQPRPSP